VLQQRSCHSDCQSSPPPNFSCPLATLPLLTMSHQLPTRNNSKDKQSRYKPTELLLRQVNPTYKHSASYQRGPSPVPLEDRTEESRPSEETFELSRRQKVFKTFSSQGHLTDSHRLAMNSKSQSKQRPKRGQVHRSFQTTHQKAQDLSKCQCQHRDYRSHR
jgi:hypothetical protein